MDYPGYGLNDGLPSATGMYEEALAAFDYAVARPDVSQVIVGGYSIGTGPAVYLAANREAAGLFLMAPFANGYDLYNNVLYWLSTEYRSKFLQFLSRYAIICV